MEANLQKKLAAILSICSNSAIIILKLAAGIISGSMTVISESIHSLTDLLASILTFFSVIKSAKPADKKHPFGHGKYEDMSGFIEGGLIICAALFIIYEALKKIMTGSFENVDAELGLYVMAISVVTNIIVSSILFKVAKSTDSISLYADAQHLRTDVLSSLGIFLGLLIIKFSRIYLFDTILAIIVAMIIFRTGLSISKKTMDNLLDSSLPDEDLETICKVLNSFKNYNVLSYKNLRARRLGPQKRVEVTLIFPGEMTIQNCHNVCDKVEQALRQEFSNIESYIHLEPETGDILITQQN